MRKLPLIIAAILLASVLHLAVPSYAQVHIWTLQANIQTGSGTTVNPGAASVNYLSTNTYLVGYEDPVVNAEDYEVKPCTLGVVCDDIGPKTELFSSDANDYSGWNVRRTLAGTLATCGEVEGSAAGLDFRKSTDGQLWTSFVETGMGSATISEGTCDVDAWSTTGYVAIASHNVDTDLDFTTSSNGGSTWALAGNIDTTVSPVSARIAVKNSTNWVVLHTTSTVTRQCNTSTAGASWSCSQLLSVGHATNADIALYYVSDDTWEGVVSSTSVVEYVRTEDGGSTWINVNVASGLTSVQGVDIVRINSTHLAVSVSRESSVQYVYFSSDGGISWVQETAHTSALSITGTGGSGIDYSDDSGLLLASFLLCDINNCWAVVVSTTLAVPIEDSASVTLTNLVGFDVSAEGGIAISRHEGGDDVSIHDAGTGELLGGPIETNCDLGGYEDAVMAKSLLSGNSNALVGFLNCDATGDSQYFSIRDTDGTVPEDSDFASAFGDPEPCGTGSWAQYEAGSALCPYDIDLASSFDEPTDSGLGQLGQVHDWPIDYSNNEQEVNDLDRRHVSWAFASQQCNDPPAGTSYCDGVEPGIVGVAMASFKDFSPDEFRQDFVEVDSDETVNDFCLGLDGGEYYLAAASNQGTHTYPVLFTASSTLDAVVGSASGNMGAGAGIACGGGQILVGTNSGTIALYTRTGVFRDSITGVDPTTRNVAISEQFVGPGGPSTGPNRIGTTCTTAHTGTNFCVQYGAYFEDSDNTIHILNLTGGVISETASFPGRATGNHHSLRVDTTLQNLWEATTTGWSRFETTSVTTVTPVTPPSSETAPGEDEDAPQPGEVSEEDINNFLESKTFVGILITLALAIFGFVLGGRAYYPGTGAMLGAALGFSASAFVGFFHPIVFLATVVLAGIVVYRRFF